MTPELDNLLCEKYPKIFADRNKGAKESCMFWGLDVGDGWFNLIDTLCSTIQSHIDWSIKAADITEKHNAVVRSVREGDLGLFNKHYEKVSEEYKKNVLERMTVPSLDEGTEYGYGIRPVRTVIPQLVAEQVKQKFAGLRFYYRGGDEFCSGAIQMAGEMSTRICEECGAPGKVGGRGWIRTLCETHRTEQNK